MVSARNWQAAAGKPRGTGALAKSVNKGKSKLNAEADKKVGDNSAKIVTALYKSWMEDGDMTCLKLLFALADERINCEDPEVMSQLCSYAESLAGEQQVTGDETDAAAKTERDEGEPAPTSRG
jgi:hypothetical protein